MYGEQMYKEWLSEIPSELNELIDLYVKNCPNLTRIPCELLH